MRKLKGFSFKGKRVLVRCDFNVPLSPKGDILDDFRIKETVPTIEYLVKKGAKVILMSHLGDPGGRILNDLKLDSIQDRLMEYLDLSVVKAQDCIGLDIEEWTRHMLPGEILLLENLRFHKGEKNADRNFARKLSRLGDIFVQDAFGTCHRPHASIALLPKILPSGMGFLLEKEINALSKLLKKIKRPLAAIVGGVKFSTKIGAIEYFCKKADFTLLGGHIANILLKARGIKMGSVLPNGMMIKDIKKTFLFKAEVRLPVDFSVAIPGQKKKVVRKVGGVQPKERAFDIGPQTIRNFSEIIKKAQTIFWNGPLGKIEEPGFDRGTKEIAKTIVKNKKAFEVVGGGDTVSAISKFNLRETFDHVSTGGGAMLDFLAGKRLPGLAVLE